MKYNIIFCFLLASLLLASCTDMDEVSKEFLTPETTYVGAADSLKVLPGRDRLVLSFELTDLSVSTIKIYWKNGTDSLIMNNVVMDTSPKLFQVPIPNMPEGTYSFNVITYDKLGNTSVTKTATGKTYGTNYQNSLLDTPVKSFYLNAHDATRADLVWGSPDVTAVGMDLYYVDTANEEVYSYTKVPHSDFEVFEDSLLLSPFKNSTDAKIRYRTQYLPEALAIDTFYTNYKDVRVKGYAVDYTDRNLWSIEGDYDPSTGKEGAVGGAARVPANALDGVVSSIWHLNAKNLFPQTGTIDMKEMKRVTGFYIYQRQQLTTVPKVVSIKVSEDKITWRAVGEFTFQKVTSRQEFDFPIGDVNCQYIQLIFKSAYEGGTSSSTSLAEFGTYTR